MSDALLVRARSEAARLRSYRDDFVGLARGELAATLHSYQETWLRSINAHGRVAIRAGRGVGKTYVAALAALAFLVTRPRARVLITAPQFENGVVLGLIPAIHALLLRSELLAQMFTVATSSITAKSDRLKRAWAITGVASETPAYVEGSHAESTLWVIDEAKAVERAVFIAALGGLTQGPDNRCLMISTPPTEKVGYFHSAFEGTAGDWVCHTISAIEARAQGGPVSQERIDEARLTLGEESPEYSAQILGVPADKQRSTLIAMGHVHAAVRRHPRFTGDRRGEPALAFEPNVTDIDRVMRRKRGEPIDQPLVCLALDPSGGGDEAIVALRQGPVLLELRKLDGTSEAAMAGGVSAVVHEWKARPDRLAEVGRIIVERGGFGRGCVETLRKEYAGLVHTWDPSGSPAERTLGNKRAEMWVNLAVLLERGEIALLADDRLEADLAAISRRTGDAGKTYVTKKEDLAAELGRSPDRGDAVALCFSGYRPGRGDTSGVTLAHVAL